MYIFEGKNVSQLTKNYSAFYPKNSDEALRNKGWGSGIQYRGSEIQDRESKIWDPESRIWRKPIPDPGVKKHRIPDPVYGIATLPATTQNRWHVLFFY